MSEHAENNDEKKTPVLEPKTELATDPKEDAVSLPKTHSEKAQETPKSAQKRKASTQQVQLARKLARLKNGAEVRQAQISLYESQLGELKKNEEGESSPIADTAQDKKKKSRKSRKKKNESDSDSSGNGRGAEPVSMDADPVQAVPTTKPSEKGSPQRIRMERMSKSELHALLEGESEPVATETKRPTKSSDDDDDDDSDEKPKPKKEKKKEKKKEEAQNPRILPRPTYPKARPIMRMHPSVKPPKTAARNPFGHLPFPS